MVGLADSLKLRAAQNRLMFAQVLPPPPPEPNQKRSHSGKKRPYGRSSCCGQLWTKTAVHTARLRNRVRSSQPCSQPAPAAQNKCRCSAQPGRPGCGNRPCAVLFKMPLHCPFPLHLSTTLALPFYCPFAALALPVHFLSAARSLPFHCPSTRPSTALPPARSPPFPAALAKALSQQQSARTSCSGRPARGSSRRSAGSCSTSRPSAPRPPASRHYHCW